MRSLALGLALGAVALSSYQLQAGADPAQFLLSMEHGDSRVAILDADGRVEGYGAGSGDVATVSVCPGGRRFAELVVLQPGRSASVAVRSIPSLTIEWEFFFSSLANSIGDIACRDSAGEQVQAFVNGPPFEGRVAAISSREIRYLSKVASHNAVIEADRLYAWTDDELLIYDLETGNLEDRASLTFQSYFAASSSSGDEVALIEVGGRRVALVDLNANTPPIVRALSIPELEYSLQWVSEDSFAILPEEPLSRDRQGIHGEASQGALIFDSQLKVQGVLRGWPALDAVAVGDRVFGADLDGWLVSAGLPDGPVEKIRRLDAEQVHGLALLTPGASGMSAEREGATSTLPVALVLILSALVGVVLHRVAARRNRSG